MLQSFFISVFIAFIPSLCFLSFYQLKLIFFHLIEAVQNKVLCSVTLKEKDVERLKEAIEDLYYFEFVLGMYAIFNNANHCRYTC